jgi:hypothetical protein
MKLGTVLLVVCGSALAAEEPKFSGGDGATMVETERHWLQKTYGGGSLVRQVLGESADGKRRFDVIVWRKPDGQTVDVCFDVTTVFEDTIRAIEAEEEHGYPHNPSR